MRLFIGIPLTGPVIGELSQAVARFKSSSGGFRWTAPESWHIILQFLGNTSLEQYEHLAMRLAELHCPTVPIQLHTFDFFHRTGIFNVAVRLTSQLTLLQRLVVAATSLCGFTPEDRPYHLHVTLARGKRQHRSADRSMALRTLQQQMPDLPVFTSFVACEFLLYESILGPTGSRYEVRKRFALSAAERDASAT